MVLPVNAGITEVRVVGNQKQIEEEEAEEDMHIEESQRVLGVIRKLLQQLRLECATPERVAEVSSGVSLGD